VNVVDRPWSWPWSLDLLVAGALLFLVAGSWAMATRTTDVSAAPIAGLILATFLVLAGSSVVAMRWPALIPASLVVWAVALIASDPASVRAVGPSQGPFGYANATAGFFAIATVAGLLVVVSARHTTARVFALVTMVGFVPVLALSRSWTVVVLLPVVTVTSVVVAHFTGVRAAVGLCGALFLAALLLTQFLGATRIGTGAGSVDRVIAATLSSDRVILWNEAMTVMLDEPLRGVGPGRFASVSPFAAADADRRYAHNEFLQAGVVAGIPGYLLSIAIVAWGFVALSRAPEGLAAPLAAASLSIAAIHASLDYVMHFPVIALSLAAVVGTGLGSPPTRGWASVPSSKEER
jgi:O-antigen ligase